MILRFFAFYEKSYEGYKPSMKQFCNKHLKRFRNMDDEQIIPHMDEIRKAMYELMTTNQDFIDSVEIRTSNEDMVMRRFRMRLDKLNDIVTSEKNPRFFSTEIKEMLYNEDSTCKLCCQKILNIDDAQVDHKVPYSKGGKTEIENAQIAHRYCNQHKSNK